MIKFWRFVALLIVMVLFVGCSSNSAPESKTETEAEIVSTDRTFPFMGVAELDTYLTEHSSKPTLLLFWTTWCPSCKQEIPEMEQLNKSHGDKVNIITVSLDENIAELNKFFEKGQLDLPVYLGDKAMAKKFKVSAIPTLVMFNREGKKTFSQPGIFPHSMLIAMVNKLIEQ